MLMFMLVYLCGGLATTLLYCYIADSENKYVEFSNVVAFCILWPLILLGVIMILITALANKIIELQE